MAGVKSLLKAAANDIEQTTKAQAKSAKITTKAANPAEEMSETQPISKPLAEDKNHKSQKVEYQKDEKKPKHPGGRPSFEKTGDTKRQQYTLTLTPDLYEMIKEYRNTHKKPNGKKMSFAEFLETSAIEYMDNHK